MDYKVDIPEGQSGDWKVEQFEVTADDEKFGRLQMRWNRVLKALSVLNETYYLRGAESEETQNALQILMEAYDKWLD